MRLKDILTFHSVPARTLLLEEGQVADTFENIFFPMVPFPIKRERK